MKSPANKLPLKLFLQFLLICLLFLTGCDFFEDLFKKDDPKKKDITNSALNISDQVLVLQKDILQSGGELIVETTDELKGLKITIPQNSYNNSKQFKIYTSKITSHELGEYFNPITPLIQIGNGGGYSNSIMELSIPLSLPSGHIPIGFFYNPDDETLEGIPIKEYNSQSVTLLTRHFMSVSDLSGTDLKNGFIDHTTNIIVGSISETLLKGITTINSGFEMGKDNWEFANYGSYISPGGHCAGQNMVAMWYYFEKKLKGETNLNNKFNTIDPFELDNALGYRFCSVIHEDLDWDGLVTSFFDDYIDKNQDLDLTKFYTIAATMLITGEPQGIGIYRFKGYNSNNMPTYGGHDLICYKVDMPSGKLFICDPNWPKDAQEILLQNNKFQPYLASSNAYTSAHQYEYITYYAKTAYIEWDKIGKRYKEINDSTIGTISPNTFPSYNIWAIEKNVDTDISNADKVPFLIHNDTLRCIIECPKAELFWEIEGKKRIDFDVYDKNGNQVDIYETNGKNYTLLKKGLNQLGFYIYGWRSGYKDKSGNDRKKFIDFKWINVYRSDLTIEPNPITGKPNEEISIQAKTDAALPSKARYEWDFGDGTSIEKVTNDNTIKHKFENGGNYTVTVKLYNDDTNELIASDSAIANIEETIKQISIQLILTNATVEWTTNNGIRDTTFYDTKQTGVTAGSLNNTSTFDEISNTFHTTIYSAYPDYGITITGYMEVIFSSDFKTVDIDVKVKDETISCTKCISTGQYAAKLNGIPLNSELSINDSTRHIDIYKANGNSLSELYFDYNFYGTAGTPISTYSQKYISHTLTEESFIKVSVKY
jgi:hypothetical protein